MAWMLCKRKYTLIPYIGETGILDRPEVLPPSQRRTEELRQTSVWKMSSQIKFGHDGHAYALHQLHRRNKRYIIPTHLARQDLRLIKSTGMERQDEDGRKNGYFIRNVENVLDGAGKRRSKEKRKVRDIRIVRLRNDKDIFRQAAYQMNRGWGMERDVSEREVIEAAIGNKQN